MAAQRRMRRFILAILSLCLAPPARNRLTTVQANLLQDFLTKLKHLNDRRRRGRGDEPKPVIVDQFLTPGEAQYLLSRYEFLMKDSLSVGYVKTQQGSGGASHSKYRTSRSIRLPPLGDAVVFDIERRAANLAGFNHSYCEDIQMACYESGELHGLHRDDAADAAARNADRSATVLVYLEAPESGGETLFTRTPLEAERDLDTGGPLRSEDGALKLFRSYCDNPKKRFVVVEPKVGLAVTWRNWLGDDLSRFAERSTHGACAVGEGKKCVIQQWMSRKNKLPLRDEAVAGIYPAGADLYYRKDGAEGGGEGGGEGEATTTSLRCLSDASANEGKVVNQLCLDDEKNASVAQLDGSEGPYRGVGAIQVTGGAFGTELPTELLDGGFTVSLWARDLKVGTTILSIGDIGDGDGGAGGDNGISLRYSERGEIKQMFELRASAGTGAGGKGGDLTEEIKVYSSGSPEQWFWFSVTFEKGRRAAAAVYSRGQLDGSASLDLPDATSTCGEQQSMSSTSSVLRILSSPPPTTLDGDEEAAGGSSSSSDLCFVVIHNTIIDDPQQVVAIGQQAQRYDKNS